MSSDAVRAAYDAWAPTYDTDEPRRIRDLAAAVLRRQPWDLSGKFVVELGCGTGTNTVWLAEAAGRVVSLDFSERMLEQARRRVTSDRVRFVSHDISAPWPVASESADLVVASLVLEHVRELTPVYKEALRVLKAGGLLCVCEFHPFQQLRGLTARYVDPATGAVVQVPAFRHNVSDFVNGGLGAGFRVAGLDDWRCPEDPAAAPPRILSVVFAKEGAASTRRAFGETTAR